MITWITDKVSRELMLFFKIYFKDVNNDLSQILKANKMLSRYKNMHNVVYLKVMGFVIFESQTVCNK